MCWYIFRLDKTSQVYLVESELRDVQLADGFTLEDKSFDKLLIQTKMLV